MARRHAKTLEEAAAAVGDGEQALHEDRHGTCLAITGGSAVFLPLDLVLLVFGIRWLSTGQSQAVGGFAAASSVAMEA